MSVARVALSHTVAAVVVIGGSALLATAVYVALLVWAILFNQGLGGPLTLPFMVLAALAAGGLAVICVLRQLHWSENGCFAVLYGRGPSQS